HGSARDRVPDRVPGADARTRVDPGGPRRVRAVRVDRARRDRGRRARLPPRRGVLGLPRLPATDRARPPARPAVRMAGAPEDRAARRGPGDAGPAPGKGASPGVVLADARRAPVPRPSQPRPARPLTAPSRCAPAVATGGRRGPGGPVPGTGTARGSHATPAREPLHRAAKIAGMPRVVAFLLLVLLAAAGRAQSGYAQFVADFQKAQQFKDDQ